MFMIHIYLLNKRQSNTDLTLNKNKGKSAHSLNPTRKIFNSNRKILIYSFFTSVFVHAYYYCSLTKIYIEFHIPVLSTMYHKDFHVAA